MSYKYENYGRKLSVREGQVGHTDQELVGINVQDQSVEAMVMVPVEDTAAVALAILEAAGIDPSIGSRPDTTPEEFESTAAFYLREAINKRSEQAEREAEDVKVADFFTKLEGLTPAFINDHDRRRYRAAREFFAKEANDAR